MAAFKEAGMDMTALAEGLAVFKSGMDGLRVAFGIVREVKGDLPEKAREQLSLALDQSEQALRIAEWQIALGLGFPLCRCEYPGTPMLTVGSQRRPRLSPPNSGLEFVPLHECPRCGLTDVQPGAGVVRNERQAQSTRPDS